MATVVPQGTLGDLAQGAIAKYLQHTKAYAKPVLADTDPENLHQMRVGLRRLRTALQVFGQAIDLPKAGRESKVAAIGRQLGQLRDLDVIHETLRHRYAPDLPDGEQFCLAVVLDHWYKQRKRTLKQTKKLIKGKRYRKMTRSLNRWQRDPQYQPLAQQLAADTVPDLLLPLVCQLWLHPGWLVGTKISRGTVQPKIHLPLHLTDQLIASEGSTLHSLRKQVKRVRYQLRLVADLYGDTLDADIQRLSEMQDTLGDLQDSTVLEAFVLAATPDAKAHMPTLFALLTDSRHQAWQQWQTHQQYYLDPGHRQTLRLTLLHPASPQAPQTHQPQTTRSQTSKPKKTRRPSRRQTTEFTS